MDDGSLVVGVIAWVLGAVVCLRGELLNPSLVAVLLFVGIAVLLAENVTRAARGFGRTGAER